MSEFSVNTNPSIASMLLNGGISDAAANGAAGAGTLGEPTESGLASFNQRAGVHSGPKTSLMSLQQRRLAPRRPPVNPGNSGASHEDEHLTAEATNAVASLLKNGNSDELEAYLKNTYDPLEQHELLRNASSQVDEKDLPQKEKDNLKEQLDGMMSDLMEQHGNVIRSGLKDAKSFSGALGTMDALSQSNNENHDPNSVRDLRTQFGSKGEGRLDAPLTPLALAYSLQTKFGESNFNTAMGDLRSKMAADLRLNPVGTPGPQLWLSLSDASAFNAVQSGFSIAGDLRRDLSERAGVTPEHFQSGTALALLNAAETGAGTADTLIEHIVGKQEMGPARRVKTYMLIRQAVDKLPTTIWSQDLLPQRLRLLDNLRTKSLEISDKLPSLSTSADEDALEQKLRGRVERKKKRDPDQSRDERSKGDNQNDPGEDQELVESQSDASRTEGK